MGENSHYSGFSVSRSMQLHRGTSLLLTIDHALDHMFLLIFAAAVTSISIEFGFPRWEDLMPYSAGAFLLFGIGGRCRPAA